MFIVLRNEHPAIPTEPQAIAGCTGRAISALRRFAKRILDLLLASIAILLLWPLMLMIAVAVRLESQGPAIYPSLRVGKRGMLFAGYKFRTMIHGADRLRHKVLHLHPRRGPFFKMADDPRVTRLGSFLRKYSLDELIPEVLSGSVNSRHSKGVRWTFNSNERNEG